MDGGKNPASDPPATVEWPEHFPPNCPPANAMPLSGSIYRFVETDPPTGVQMKSWLELGIGSGSNCRRASMSCRVSLEDIREVQAATAKWKGKPIACATLSADDGQIKQTGQDPTHYSVWLRRTVHARAHELFMVVP